VAVVVVVLVLAEESLLVEVPVVLEPGQDCLLHQELPTLLPWVLLGQVAL
jgi:hypothetical protein